MRKTRKWIVGAGLAVSVLSLTLTGCGGNTSSDNTATTGANGATIDEAHSVGAMADYAVGTDFKASQPVDISLLYRDHSNYPVKDDWMFFQQLQQNQNVTFTRDDIPMADWQTKRGLEITGGNPSEVMPIFYLGEETPYVASGVLLPISDYVQYMPNFQADLKNWGLSDALDTHRQADGKYYDLPSLMEIPNLQYSIIVRDDAWQAAGLKDDPTTMDELQADLKQLKDSGQCSQYPLSAGNNAKDILQAYAPGYNTQAGDWMWQGGSAYWDGSQNKYVFSGAQDQYKDLLTFMSGLVSSGLMDPASMTQGTTDNSASDQKFTTGQSCATTGNDQDATRLQKTLQQGGTDTTTHLLNIPAGPYGNYITGGTRFGPGLIFSAKLADDPHFKAILQFVDWLYFSQNGIEFAQWGVPCPTGVTDSTQCTYTKAADGTRKLLPDINNSQGLNPAGTKLLNVDYGFSNGAFWLGSGSFKELMMSYYTPIKQAFINKVSNKQELPIAPNTPMDSDTQQAVSALYTALRDSENTNLAKFITGQSSVTNDWNSYISELQGMSMDQYITYYNDNVKR
jgi:putative aldouronate transport system substrate-binding protein